MFWGHALMWAHSDNNLKICREHKVKGQKDNWATVGIFKTGSCKKKKIKKKLNAKG